MARTLVTLCLALGMLLPGPARAATDPDAAAVRRHANDVLIRRMDHYVDPRMTPRLVAQLSADRDRILALGDDAAFMQAINADLYAVSHDRHLTVWLSDGRPPASEAPNGGYGIEGVERPAPGIGLVRLSGFSSQPASIAAIDAAMDKLRGVRVLIVDLRDNGGGGMTSMLRFLGHLFPARTELNGVAWRTCLPQVGAAPDACVQGEPRIEREFTDQPASPAAAEARIYVLVSHGTFSAAEAVAYELQQHRRALILGETTGGGGNPSAAMDLESAFYVIMPIGRLHRVTPGRGWEGVGVRPDLHVAATRSLAAALDLARR